MSRGRPKGSKNVERIEVAELPAACPACGSVSLKVQRGQTVTRQDYAGVTNCGKPFAAVEWVDKVCDCGQNVRVRRYLPAAAK